MMSSHLLADATIDVLLYDNGARTWVTPDGSEFGNLKTPGQAVVRLIQEDATGVYRIVALRRVDNSLLLNQLIYENFHYKAATPTFHQWKSEVKQVYGLNFPYVDQANVFLESVERSVVAVNAAISQPQYHAINNPSNGVYQDPQMYAEPQHHIQQPLQQQRRDIDQESIGSAGLSMGYRGGKSSYSSLNGAPPSAASNQLQQQQRRCSQGSSGSSGQSSSTNIYATSNGNGYHPQTAPPPGPAPAPLQSNGVTRIPVPPPAPPPLASMALSSNGAKSVAPIAGNAPPPPPPPPPANFLKSGGLADQLNNRAKTLRKVSSTATTGANGDAPTASPAPKASISGTNFLDELKGRLESNKIQANNNTDTVSTSSSSGVSSASVGAATSDTSDSGATLTSLRKPNDMDFLQASIDAALKETTPPEEENFDDDDGQLDDDEAQDGSYENDDVFASFANSSFSAFNGSNSSNGANEEESTPIDDEQPPVLEDSNALSGLNQVMESPPVMARAYQEDVIPLEKCVLTGNRFTIHGCKYEFVRLNVRNNIYFRCVQCYAIYQRCRALSSRTNALVQIPSVGSLKMVAATNEIRGNPYRPSGIAHCCENETFRDAMKNSRANEAKAKEALKIINSAISANGVNNNESEDFVVPLDKCKFMDKRLEIDGCNYIFSRTQSGPRDYYRCSACIALYHKRHFRKLATPKIGSLSLVRDTGVLTGDPNKPRGLPHICDNPELHCAPLRGESRMKFRQPMSILPSALSGILEAAKKMNTGSPSTWPNVGMQVPTSSDSSPTVSNGSGNETPFSPNLKRNFDFLNKMEECMGSGQKYRRIMDNVVPLFMNGVRSELNLSNGSINVANISNGRSNGSASPSNMSNGATRSDTDSEGFYPHTDDVQTNPAPTLPDCDLSFSKRQTLFNGVLSQFPKQPNQGRVYIFADSLLCEFDSKALIPSTSLVRAAHPITPCHVSNLAVRASSASDCFSKTKYVFYALGYDVLRCLDVSALSRKMTLIQNEFLEFRSFLDAGSAERGNEISLAFVTIPEIGVLSAEIKELNQSMRALVHDLDRKDVACCDWAAIFERESNALESVQDRMKRLLVQMSSMCRLELLDED